LWPYANVFRYQTFRMAFAVVTSFFLLMALAPAVIRVLRRLKIGDAVDFGNPAVDRMNATKAGTPTMGGILIVGAVLAAALIGGWLLAQRSAIPMNRLLVLLGATAAFAAIGLADDLLKVRRGRSLGLKARHKLMLQFVVAAGFVVALASAGWERAGIDKPFALSQHAVRAAFWIFAVVLTSNAVNLADGLDGLAAGLCVVAGLGFAVIGGVAEVWTFGLALAGACLGFLWFNRHPARLFMGDVGSLALGAAIAGMAALMNNPVVLVGLCLVPYIEAGSVIIQVASFKTTGKRVFKMSPIHHHFELSGWSERRVVWTFWGVALAVAVATALLAPTIN
ncbi:MAG: phospho-N-acetylmuramoyl-pentapeptide-transferase, partial [Armatimonadetes bacterium]|nr:phospho-N-acetylmuramoyl-pentapeptide-transferase [Armatimonadota bacterium]